MPWSLPMATVPALSDRAVTTSPYLWVRTASAEQLALHNQPGGLRFLLAAVETNRPDKSSVIQWVKNAFPDQLPHDPGERQIIEFLRAKVETPPDPP